MTAPHRSGVAPGTRNPRRVRSARVFLFSFPTFSPHLFGTIGLGWVESNCTVFSHPVHENGCFHGQSSIFGGVVHGNGLFHGRERGSGGVVHEIRLFHGRVGVEGWVVHENGLSHGQQTSLVDDGFGKMQVVEA